MSSFTICSKCGKKKFARQEIIDKRIAAGNIESWVCRECKKFDKNQVKQAIQDHVEEIQKEEVPAEIIEQEIEEPILIKEEDEEDFFAR